MNTTQRFYIKTAPAVDAMKKLGEKISGTAGSSELVRKLKKSGADERT